MMSQQHQSSFIFSSDFYEKYWYYPRWYFLMLELDFDHSQRYWRHSSTACSTIWFPFSNHFWATGKGTRFHDEIFFVCMNFYNWEFLSWSHSFCFKCVALHRFNMYFAAFSVFSNTWKLIIVFKTEFFLAWSRW